MPGQKIKWLAKVMKTSDVAKRVEVQLPWYTNLLPCQK